MSLPHRELAVLLLLTVRPLDRLIAQVTWTGHLGVTATSTMVTDQIIESIHLKPGLEPTLNLSASLPLKAKTPVSAVAELQVTTGTLRRNDGSNKTDLASMRTTTVLIGLSGHLAGQVQFLNGIGIIYYDTT